MKKTAILDPETYGKGGIDTFIRNTNPYIIENLENTERVNYKGIRDSYPLSQTIEKFTVKRRLEKKLEDFNRIYVPSQTMMYFDPREFDAEVIVYVHDILPVTTCYHKYRNNSFVERLDGYLAKSMGLRYVKFLVHADKILTPSEFTKKEIETRTAYEGKVEVVRQGSDHLPEPESYERDIDLLYVGAVYERKNPEMVKETLSEAQENGLNVAWVNTEDTGLPGKSFINITDEELAEVYSRTKFYLHPSYAEGMGRGPVEAQRFGAVPLALDRGINHEVLGEAGKHWLTVSCSEDVLNVVNGEEEFNREEVMIRSDRSWDSTREKLVEELQG